MGSTHGSNASLSVATGEISAASATGFTIAGADDSNTIVDVKKSTPQYGDGIAAGHYAIAVGTLSTSGVLSAVEVGTSRSAIGSVSDSGVVSGVNGSYFTMKSSLGYINVWVLPSTTLSGTVSVGERAQVTGIGTIATTIAATKVTLSRAAPLSVATGKISAASATRFTIAGADDSNTIVDVTKSTALYGDGIAVGHYAIAVGTASIPGVLSAVEVGTSKTAIHSVTDSGVVSEVNDNEFTMKSSLGYIAVWTLPSTTLSGPVSVGERAQVTGIGTVATTIAATNVTLSGSGGSAAPTESPSPDPTAADAPLKIAYDACQPAYLPRCSSGTTLPQRLADMASLGFNAVINYNGVVATATGADSLGTEIDTSHADGLAFIVSVKDIVPSLQSGEQHPYAYYAKTSSAYPLTATCVNPSTQVSCQNDDDYIKYIASLALPHAGTWGYYVADEPQTGTIGRAGWDSCTGDVPAINRIIADIRTQDTIHPVLIVLGWWYSRSQSDMTAQVGCFTDSAKNMVVGIDYYPFPGTFSSNYSTWLAGAVSANASKGVVGGVYIGQALSGITGGSAWTWPSLANMEEQKTAFSNAHISNGIYGLFWYPDIISAPSPSDDTPVATKRADVTKVLTW